MNDPRQPDLFAPSTLAALAARDAAIEQVADNAEEAAPGFAAAARDFVLDYLSEAGPCDAETITDACLEVGIVPHDLRAFGPVYLALAREGLIVKAGVSTRRRRGHGTSGGNVWRLAEQPP